MTPTQRRTALLAWITVALAGSAITWLGLVGLGLLLTQGGAGYERDWTIAFTVLAVGLAVVSLGIWMVNRMRQRRG